MTAGKAKAAPGTSRAAFRTHENARGHHTANRSAPIPLCGRLAANTATGQAPTTAAGRKRALRPIALRAWRSLAGGDGTP